MKILFSFGLWGNDPKYLEGARLQPAYIRKFFPTASIWIWIHEKTVLPSRELLEKEGVRFFPITDSDADFGCCRLYGDHSNFNFVCFRDLDSRMIAREATAIWEWALSRKSVHIMRDHPHHTRPILGGMWGYRPGGPPANEIEKKLVLWRAKSPENRITARGVNERFLSEVIWPEVKDFALEHGSFNKDLYPNQIPFPMDRGDKDPGAFVGEIITADGRFCPEDREARNKAL